MYAYACMCVYLCVSVYAYIYMLKFCMIFENKIKMKMKMKMKVFIGYILYVRNSSKFRYPEESLGAFFDLQPFPNVSTKFSTFCFFVFLLTKFIL